MKCSHTTTKNLAKVSYISALLLCLAISCTFFADFQTLGVNVVLPAVTMDPIQVSEVRKVPLKGKLFRMTYFQSSELVVFSGSNPRMQRTCAGYFKAQNSVQSSFLGYHVVQPSAFKDTVLADLNVSCVPMNNDLNWTDFQKLGAFFAIATLVEVVVLILAASLICVRQESWCRCRNQDGIVYNVCC
ncbi:Hypothetical_protein [Hexamita inflata]|uniref:Hypothetical_protein n=1 Tax=Hexamita inflata TaxID=28002 RepID=A0AA86UK63_9EUKA|nr:Hypothetical protein HINF_LOCUS41972 [Hexamita inflata]